MEEDAAETHPGCSKFTIVCTHRLWGLPHAQSSAHWAVLFHTREAWSSSQGLLQNLIENGPADTVEKIGQVHCSGHGYVEK